MKWLGLCRDWVSLWHFTADLQASKSYEYQQSETWPCQMHFFRKMHLFKKNINKNGQECPQGLQKLQGQLKVSVWGTLYGYELWEKQQMLRLRTIKSNTVIFFSWSSSCVFSSMKAFSAALGSCFSSSVPVPELFCWVAVQRRRGVALRS